jgi:hypothetical protein
LVTPSQHHYQPTTSPKLNKPTAQARSRYCAQYPTGVFDVIFQDAFEDPDGSPYDRINHSSASLIVYATPDAREWTVLLQDGYIKDEEEGMSRLWRKVRKECSQAQSMFSKIASKTIR